MRLVNFHNIISECLNKFLVMGIGDISVCKVNVLKFVVFLAVASLLLYIYVCVCGALYNMPSKKHKWGFKNKKEKEFDKLRTVPKA